MSTEEIFIDGHKLPKLLSDEEFCDLLQQAQNGDNEARNKIIEHNTRLVLYEVTNKFKTVDYEKKELVSIGILGLFKAVDTFDISKNIRFSSYASRCIDNEIIMFLRKLDKDKKIESLDKVIFQNRDGSKIKLEDYLSDGKDFAGDYIDNNETSNLYQVLRELINELPDKSKKIIKLHFGFYNNRTYNQKEIAEMLNISQSYVSRIIIKTVKELREKLRDKDIIELDIIESGKRKRRNANTIYEYFGNYSKEQIDEMLTKLNGEEMKLIRLRFGEDLNISSSTNLTEEQSYKFYGLLATKMKRLLKNPNTNLIKLKTIYEHFNNYSKEQVDEMLSKLSEEDKKLIRLRYGDDLNEHVLTKLTKEESNKFYSVLVPRMKKLLENPTGKRTQRIKKEVKKPVLEIKEELGQKETVSETNNIEITKEDCLKLIDLVKAPSFAQLMKILSVKEAVVIALRLGYIDGRCFSTKSISAFLNIEPEEVIDITKKVLLNSFLDNVIEIATEEKRKEKVLTLKKD